MRDTKGIARYRGFMAEEGRYGAGDGGQGPPRDPVNGRRKNNRRRSDENVDCLEDAFEREGLHAERRARAAAMAIWRAMRDTEP